MDQIQAQVFALLQNVILALITVLGGMVVRYFQKHFSAKQMENAKGIAKTAVSSMQEIGKAIGLNGQQKLAAAISQAQDFGSKAGIKLTSEQWNALIHDALAAFKNIWNAAIESEPVSTVTEPVVYPSSTATQAEPASIMQIPGRWVLGGGFICHFPVADKKNPNQFFTPTTITHEEFEKLKAKVESYAEKTDMSLTEFYASIYVK